LWSLPVVVLAFGWIASTIRVNNYMLEDLENDHFLKKEFRFVEEKFSGARPFEMAIQLDQNADLWNPQVLHVLDSLDQFLRNQYGVGAMISAPALIKSANKSLNGGQEGYYSIPDSLDIVAIQKLLRRKEFAEAFALVYHDETKTLRYTGKVGDLGRDYFEKKNSELKQFTDQFQNAGMTFRVTGTAHLIDYNNAYLVENMLFDIILSILAVALVVGLMFGSLRTALLTLIPNVIPLAGIAAFMALAGIDIKISTSIIFNIAFGIAVDDTIHFMGKLKLLQMRGYRKNYAVKRTFISTGKAIILTTLILCAGFVSLIFSSFMGTFYVGLLVTLTLLMALVADLLYSPVLVLTFGKDKKLKPPKNHQALPED
jgi:predicted RND superfamily exporter protein